MFRILREFLYAFIGLLGGLVSIWLFAREVVPELPGNVTFAVAFVGAFGLYYFVENMYLKVKWGRNSKYGQALSIINEGLEGVHELNRQNPSVEKAVTEFRALCDDAAKAFSLVTGTNCCISIKVLIWDEDTYRNIKLRTVTFCRDSYSQKKRLENRNVKHWLDGNQDFLQIVESLNTPSNHVFFSNILPFLYDYRNTSFQVYGSPQLARSDLLPFMVLLRYWMWTLPYRSTIVVPIAPRRRRTDEDLIGFLTVDSPKIFAFRRGYDVDLMYSIADSIYDPLSKISRENDFSGG